MKVFKMWDANKPVTTNC